MEHPLVLGDQRASWRRKHLTGDFVRSLPGERLLGQALVGMAAVGT